MLSNLKFLISPKEKLNFVLLSLFLLISTFIEIISIATLPIFVSILMNPEYMISKASNFFDVNFLLSYTDKELLINGSSLIFVVFLIKNSLIGYINYFNGTIHKRVKSELAKKLFKKYIFASYEYHMSKNSSEIIRNTSQEVDKAIRFLFSYIMMFKEAMILFSILFLLLITDFKTTCIIFLFLGTASVVYYLIIKKSSEERGELIQKLWEKNFRTINHAIGSIKFLKILNKENFMNKIFEDTVLSIEKYSFIQRYLLSLPKLILETITVLMFLIITVYFLNSGRSVEALIPLITLITVCAIRLIPSLTLISVSYTMIKHSSPSYNLILNELRFGESQLNNELKNSLNRKNIEFNKNIELKNIEYKYPNSEKIVLKNINLEIKKGEIIGITGKSGAGKSTLIDLIIGLITPIKGEALVDGKKYNVSNWQRSLGYVPQDVFVLDDTIKANIAFGEDEQKINEKQFLRAIKLSQLENFVETSSEKELTHLGDRGSRMSGGQRQRLGIARCLYFDPKLIILDEPTSSLDLETEETIINDIYNLTDYTIILISHRQSVFKNCKKIYKLEENTLNEVKNFRSLS